MYIYIAPKICIFPIPKPILLFIMPMPMLPMLPLTDPRPVSLSMMPRLLLPRLPLRRPSHQLVPISTLVLRAKARHAANFRVYDFDGRIRLAHEAVSDQVDAMPDVGRAVHHRDVFVDDFLARDRGGVEGPVALADPVKTVQLMEDRPCRPLRCDSGVLKEAALLWKDGFPGCVGSIGGSGAEGAVVAEDLGAG